MMILQNCTITDADGVVGLKGAVVSVSGDSPNATVRISERDEQHRKFRPFDRVLAASIRGSGNKWFIEGSSEQLRAEVGTEDDRISLSVEVKGGCQGCR